MPRRKASSCQQQGGRDNRGGNRGGGSQSGESSGAHRGSGGAQQRGQGGGSGYQPRGGVGGPQQERAPQVLPPIIHKHEIQSETKITVTNLSKKIHTSQSKDISPSANESKQKNPEAGCSSNIQVSASSKILEEKDMNIEEKCFEKTEQEDSDGFHAANKNKRKEIQKLEKFVGEKFNFDEFNKRSVYELANLNSKFQDILLEEALTKQNNDRKKNPKGDKYKPEELVQEARDFLKKGNYVFSAESCWASYSCAVSNFFAQLQIDIESHSGTNVLAYAMVECYKGQQWILRRAIESSNKCHKAFYKLVKLENLKDSIDAVEYFIREIKSIKEVDVRKKLTERSNEENQIIIEKVGKVKFYYGRHREFIFGYPFDFINHADNIDKKDYYSKKYATK